MSQQPARSTTILSVRRGNDVALGGDGQVTLGNVVAKHDAVKIRRLAGGKVVLVDITVMDRVKDGEA